MNGQGNGTRYHTHAGHFLLLSFTSLCSRRPAPAIPRPAGEDLIFVWQADGWGIYQMGKTAALRHDAAPVLRHWATLHSTVDVF
jgi:hypothetical protein